MSTPNVGASSARVLLQLLRLRLALLRANPLTLLAALVLLSVLGSLWWSAYAVGVLQGERTARNAQAAHAAAAASRAGVARISAQTPAQTQAQTPAQTPAQDNLAAFYDALGERRAAEQQVKTLFGLAAKSGLTLAQGEYKSAYDRNAHVWTYQVNLPVKGSYDAIWQFAFGSLRAIPFASLDDIGFRRDAIGDPQVEARLRLTLYLADHLGDRRTDRPDRPDGTAGGAP